MSRDPRFSGPQLDAFHPPELPRQESHAPYQPASATSREAAETITRGPAFAGNKSACLKAIAKYDSGRGVTRKQLAAELFGSQQQYVTGPVNSLIHEDNYVYEEPARDRHGAIMTRLDRKTGKRVVVPLRIDSSAVLRLTPKGKAATATRGAA